MLTEFIIRSISILLPCEKPIQIHSSPRRCISRAPSGPDIEVAEGNKEEFDSCHFWETTHDSVEDLPDPDESHEIMTEID